MVAHLVRLRLLVLRNTLSRSTWQLVAVILGGLYGLGVLAGAAIALVALGAAPPEVARTATVLAGSALVLGWIVFPVLLAGIDQNLDPARLVTFPIPRRRLMLGLAAGGVLGIPGVVTSLAALATVGTWWRFPLSALAAVACAAVGVAICIVGSRLTAAASTGLGTRRRFREVVGVLLFVPLVLLGPILAGLGAAIGDAADALPRVTGILAWTPLGAIWSVPADLAVGEVGVAAARFLIGLATLALLVLLWDRALAIALVTPPHAASRTTAPGRLGWFGRFPGTPAGAVAARSLTYWTRDPRYSRQLLLVPIFPALIVFYSATLDAPPILNASGPVVAFILALSIFSDISFDHSAFALHVAKGVPGVADRTGRALAVAVFALPVSIGVTVATVAYTGAWSALPGLLGIAVGVLLSGLGLSSVSSALVVVPVAAAGDNPFKSPPGAGFTTALTTFATWGALGVLVLPELVLAVVGFATGVVGFGWAALVVGAGLGSVLLVVGIRMGGRRVDLMAPELLARATAQA